MPTFYGLLDVDPDTDEQSIRRAYRELAKRHHPDVSDAPDARKQFQRLTTAKEVLTDSAERARYDRLGHERYVSQHLAGDAWTVRDDPHGTDAPTAGDGGTAGTERVSHAAQRTASENATAATTHRTHQRADRNDGYATASEYYRPGQRIGVETRGGFARTVGALRDVLPWLLAHLVLFAGALAVALALLLSTSDGALPPITSVFVATAMVGATAGISVLHLAATVFR